MFGHSLYGTNMLSPGLRSIVNSSAESIPDVGALRWNDGGAFIWSDDDYIVPSLDLNFALFKDLRPRIGPTPTFTRASGNATYFDASGVLTTAAINRPRFDHVYNGVSWVSKGLLVEEARTNLLSNSDDFSVWSIAGTGQINLNTAVAPDGTATADEIQCNSASANPIEVYRAITYSAVKYSASVYAKYVNNQWMSLGTNGASTNQVVWFDILNGIVGNSSANYSGSIVNCGNGWFRANVIFTGGSPTSNYIDICLVDGNGLQSSTSGGKILVWGAQVESGAFPTSYIPTTTAAVTRSAEVCQITGGDFSGFWNASEGSVVAEFDYNDISYGSGPYRIGNDPSGTYSYTNSRLSTTSMYLEGYSNGTTPVYFTISPILSANKTAFGYKTNDFALSTNGASVQTDTSGATVLNIANIYIGSPGGGYLNGHIARLRYFNTRLTNSQLQVLST